MRSGEFLFDECFYPDPEHSDHHKFSSSSDSSHETISIEELEMVSIPYDKHPLYRNSEDESTDIQKINEPNVYDILTKDALIKSLEKKLEKRMREEFERTQGISPLLSQVLIGMVRDFVWALFTYRNVDYFDGKLGAYWGPTLTQTFAAFLPTFSVIRLTTKIYPAFFLDNRKNWLKTQAALAVASWTSIPFWNGAQILGQMAGEWLGLNSTKAGYMSGFMTGITETLWQNFLVIPFSLNQPLEPLEIALNTLGGAMWQWVYQANLSDKPVEGNISLQEITAAAEVAGAVALSTLLMTSLAWKIKKLRSQKTPIEMTTMADENNDIAQEKKEATPLLAHTSRLFHRSPAININIQEDELNDRQEDKSFYRQK